MDRPKAARAATKAGQMAVVGRHSGRRAATPSQTSKAIPARTRFTSRTWPTYIPIQLPPMTMA